MKKRVNVPLDVTQAGNKLRVIIEGSSGNFWNKFLVFFGSGGVIMYPLFLIALVSVHHHDRTHYLLHTH